MWPTTSLLQIAGTALGIYAGQSLAKRAGLNKWEAIAAMTAGAFAGEFVVGAAAGASGLLPAPATATVTATPTTTA